MPTLIEKQIAAIAESLNEDAPKLSSEWFKKAKIVRPTPPSQIDERTWRRFHRDQARRERYRYVNNARHDLPGPAIRPAAYMQPQLMVKNDDGSWSPEIKRKEA